MADSDSEPIEDLPEDVPAIAKEFVAGGIG